MMDEFEMFRARAYGGGHGCPPRLGFHQGGNDDDDADEESVMIAAMRSKSKRRHSSVGIVGTVAESYGPLGGAAVLNNYTPPSRNQVETVNRGSDGAGAFGCDRWRSKPRLPSQVTVAIEPPSPTDPHCGGGGGGVDDYGRPRLKQHYKHQQAIDDDDDDDDDEDDDDGDDDDDEESRVKAHHRQVRQNLQRTHTAPAHTRSPSPRRQRVNGGQRHLEDHGSNRTPSSAAAAGVHHRGGGDGVETHPSQFDFTVSDEGRPSSQLPRSDETPPSAGGGGGDIRRRSPSVKKGQRPGGSSSSSSKSADQGQQRRDSRPDNLRPNTAAAAALSPGGATGGAGSMARRKSVTCSATDGLRLTQPSPSAHRRNSYTGAVALMKPTSPPTGAGFNTGRRGSAITYLTDAPAPGSLGWRQPSPAGSPSRRKSCVEDIGRGDAVDQLLGRTSSTGGLNPDDIRNHLEDLTRAAAEATSGTGSKVNSRASSINHKTSNRPSVAGSPSGGGSGSTTDSSESPTVYRVMVLGAQGVGKTTLAQQLMTSEYLANKENHQDVDDPEHMVCVRLDDEVAMVAISESTADEHQHLPAAAMDVDAYLVVYSVTDRLSFSYAQSCIQGVGRSSSVGEPRTSPTAVVVLVANKQDLVRNRTISTTEGKRFALKRRWKYIEVSALLDHKVDEVLVTLIRECRSRQRKLEWDNFGEVSDDDLGCLSRVLEICSKICK